MYCTSRAVEMINKYWRKNTIIDVVVVVGIGLLGQLKAHVLHFQNSSDD
jgi:hypothetical protein